MKNVTVLFVDDEENLLNTFKRLFRRESFKDLYASSGHEALEILKSNRVDLMVTDQRMPRMNGMELYKKSREQFQTKIHKRMVDIINSTPKTVESLMKLDLPAGVDIEIKV